MARRLCKSEKKNSVCLISAESRKHFKPGFLFSEINWMKEERHFHEITLKDTRTCLEVLFSSHKSFVGFCFLDIENET